MRPTEIRHLAEKYSLEALKAAEEKLLADETLPIEVGGEDSGEKLTHVLGAIYILEEVNKGIKPNVALRAFIERVRNSIN
jgi:hypothetical protein